MCESKVSVVLTTYNRPKLMKRALSSVMNQTYSNWECIVVDDASEELVGRIVDSCEDSRVRYHRHDENKGLSAARNTGLRLAEGSMIAYLDDDDEWLPGKLTRQTACLQSSGENVGLVYCWMEWMRDGEVFKRRRPTLRGNVLADVLDRQPLGNGSTWLVRKEVVERHGGFDESLPRGIDGDLLRRLCMTHDVDFVSETLVRYHTEHGQTRITRADRTGVQNAIIGQQTKLRKFRELLRSLPRERTNIYANLGFRYAQLGKWGTAFSYFRDALQNYPVSGHLYLRILQALRSAFKN